MWRRGSSNVMERTEHQQLWLAVVYLEYPATRIARLVEEAFPFPLSIPPPLLEPQTHYVQSLNLDDSSSGVFFGLLIMNCYFDFLLLYTKDCLDSCNTLLLKIFLISYLGKKKSADCRLDWETWFIIYNLILWSRKIRKVKCNKSCIV
jgi:hypothetical protein